MPGRGGPLSGTGLHQSALVGEGEEAAADERYCGADSGADEQLAQRQAVVVVVSDHAERGRRGSDAERYDGAAMPSLRPLSTLAPSGHGGETIVAITAR